MQKTRWRFAPLTAFFVLLVALATQRSLAQEYFDQYGLVTRSAALDLGGQPLGYPSGVISAVMQRDRILQASLVKAGHPLKAHAFKRGADMVGLLGDHRLEAGLLGDMPTILVACAGQVVIVGLVKQTTTSIVASGATQVLGLKGKRIGYIPVSSAHSTLLRGLASAGLTETDVTLVPLGVDAMPGALARGEIDAFSAWEPALSLALTQNEKNRVVYRGLSSDYFVIERDFERRSPEAARQLVAGFVRAIEWMRLSQKNLETAARWVLSDGLVLTGQAAPTPLTQIMAITRRDILNVPSAPVILHNPGAAHPLKNEYQFLVEQGKVPPTAQWDAVARAFQYDGLTRVLADAKAYKLRVFDYAD